MDHCNINLPGIPWILVKHGLSDFHLSACLEFDSVIFGGLLVRCECVSRYCALYYHYDIIYNNNIIIII